ncbi:hypothetical protein [Symbioplanes lichenis]|uniref:hypothetical protein n=1 Tax=Symbioplanes lichenis TaxID=1629072 RepID=UPI0027389899|nr:hypothetical protein [Actinoplanes lichenis]
MLDTDVRPELETDEDDRGGFNRRRLIRVVAVLTLGILAVLAVWQDPVHAGLF